ncbi:hypothetical protein T492DRAFT_491498 [Pavlovales sp. CCMP2436]|nr:hypothetical protein T492DRAFT_491498 [Pavlovales sp. CCMP2436]
MGSWPSQGRTCSCRSHGSRVHLSPRLRSPWEELRRIWWGCAPPPPPHTRHTRTQTPTHTGGGRGLLHARTHTHTDRWRERPFTHTHKQVEGEAFYTHTHTERETGGGRGLLHAHTHRRTDRWRERPFTHTHTHTQVEGEAVPRSDGGSPIGDLLRPVSIPMQLLEWVARAYELCVGHEVARVGVPTNVLVAHEAVLMVEGEAFAREAVHVALAYELLADEVGRAPLNLAGRFFVQSLLNKGARARCGVYEHIARNPSIAKMHLPAPVFIIGLPRTGSTHLQSLLSADRMTETLKLYEMLDPLPLCEPNSNGARLRVGKLALQKIMMDALAPGNHIKNIISNIYVQVRLENAHYRGAL